MKPYIRVSIQQGTSEWRSWRREGIGASDVSSIMNENPYKSRARLLDERRLAVDHEITTLTIKLGIQLEPQGRIHFIRTTGIDVEPACFKSTQFEWLRASVDGFSAAADRVLEIKCGRSAYQKTYASGRPPRYYYGQLQHILAVTGLPFIDFLCFFPPCKPIHLTVARDEEYIARLLVACEKFWMELRGPSASGRSQ